MITTVYTATRHPGRSPEAFTERWRAHAGLAMSQPGFWGGIQRYAQGDAVIDPLRFPGIDETVDGVGQIWWPDMSAHSASMRSQALREVIVPDGSDTFVRESMRSVTIDESVLRPARLPMPIRIYLFTGPPDDPSGTAAASWHEWLRDTLPAATFPYLAAGRARDPTAPFGSVTELGFLGLEQAAAGYAAWQSMSDGAGGRDRAARRDHCVVITRQRLLYDRAEC